MRWWTRLTSHIPPGQFGRYLMVGAFNTLFGYSTYVGLTALFEPRIPHGYLVAGALAYFPNITVAFLGYKWFVFKTKGNYLREWSRCFVVYGGNLLLGLLMLPCIVYGLHLAGMGPGAPYAAGAIQRVVAVICSFIGHKTFSFRRPETRQVSMSGGPRQSRPRLTGAWRAKVNE